MADNGVEAAGSNVDARGMWLLGVLPQVRRKRPVLVGEQLPHGSVRNLLYSAGRLDPYMIKAPFNNKLS
jgi:hypothetical protein